MKNTLRKLIILICIFLTVSTFVFARYAEDINGDGRVNVRDIIIFISYIFIGFPSGDIDCDVNGDGRVNISDIIHVIGVALTNEEATWIPEKVSDFSIQEILSSEDIFSVELTWTDEFAEKTKLYYLEKSEDNLFKENVLTFAVYDTSYTDQLPKDKEYFYRVQSASETKENNGRLSDYSEIKSVAKPNTPSEINVYQVNNNVVLNWTDNSSVETGFDIYRSNSSDGEFVLIETVESSVAEYRDSGLTDEETYFYAVCSKYKDFKSDKAYSKGVIFKEHAEFQVNVSSDYDQKNPEAARLKNGGFVVVWQSYAADGDGYGIFARIFSADGAAVSDDMQVNSFALNDQCRPKVAGLASGGFVVVWESFAQDSDNLGVFAQVFDENGNAAGTEIQVHETVEGYQCVPCVASLRSGGFVIAWVSGAEANDSDSIYVRVFDEVGVALTSEVQANDTDETEKWEIDLAVGSDNSIIVCWDSYWYDPGVYQSKVMMRKFDSALNAAGNAIEVNTYWEDNNDFAIISRPCIAYLRDNGFAVVWQSSNQDGDGEGIFARVYDAELCPVTAEFQVNEYSEGYQEGCSVSSLNDGSFSVVWVSYGGSSDIDVIVGQIFDASGNKRDEEFLLNDYMPSYKYLTDVIRLNDAQYLTVWDTAEQDGSGLGIYAKIDGTVYARPMSPYYINVERTYSCASIEWEDTSSNEEGFRIYRSVNSVDDFEEIGVCGSNENSFTDSAVAAGTTYHYYISSFNSKGESEDCVKGVFNFLTPYTVPELIAVAENNLFQCLDTSGMPYYYRIYEQDSVWHVPNTSNWIGAELKHWLEFSSASYICIYVYAYEDTSFTLELKKGSDFVVKRTFEVKGSPAWQIINFELDQSIKDAGVVDYMAFSRVTKPLSFLGIFSDCSLKFGCPRFTVGSSDNNNYMYTNDNFPDGVNFVSVFRTVCNANEMIEASDLNLTEPYTVIPAGTYYRDYNVETGKKYYYAFMCTADSGASEQGVLSTIYQVIHGDNSELEKPVLYDPGNLSKEAITLNLKWSKSTESRVSFYELQIACNNLFSEIYQKLNVDLTETNVTLTEEGEYFFRLRACSDDIDMGGTFSGWSNIVDFSINPNDAPDAPVLIDPGAEVNQSGFEISWTDESDSGAEIYYVEEALTSDFSSILNEYVSFSTKLQINKYDNGKYYYRVRAVNNSGTIPAFSEYSNVVDVVINRDLSIPLVPLVDVFCSPTNSALQTISGEKEQDVSIYINDSEFTSVYSPHWSAEIMCTDQGENYFNIKAVRANGMESEIVQVVIEYDTVAPEIEILSPAPGETIYQVPVAFKVRTESEKDLLFLNGERVYGIGNNEYILWLEDLAEGVNKFTLEATDVLGNTRDREITLVYVPYEAGENYTVYALTEDMFPDEGNAPEVNTDVILQFEVNNNNEPVAGETVAFKVLTGTGVLNVREAETDSEGIAEVVLTTGLDIDEPDIVEAALAEFLTISSEVRIFSKPAAHSQIEKLTEETQDYALGANIDLRVRIKDQYENIVSGVPLACEVVSGRGVLNAETVTSNLAGEASVMLSMDNALEDNTRIMLTSLSDSGVSVMYNIQTQSDSAGMTVEALRQMVDNNAGKINDFQADIYRTSNADFLPAVSTLHVWQKGDLQKVEQYTPESKVFIRPQLEKCDPVEIPEYGEEIVSFDSENNIYAVKSYVVDEESFKYNIDYIDVDMGVVVRSESYHVDDDMSFKWIYEYESFVQIAGAYVCDRKKESFCVNECMQYETNAVFSNIVANNGIADSVFE